MTYDDVKVTENHAIYDVDVDDIEDDNTNSDRVIAQLLQNQFNDEYDLMLKRTEDKMNGTSKGIIIVILLLILRVYQLVF